MSKTKLSKKHQQAFADLEWWRKVFDHMPQWRVFGFTDRWGVSVLDHEDRTQEYTYRSVLPILVLKGMVDLTLQCKDCQSPVYEAKHDRCYPCDTKFREEYSKRLREQFEKNFPDEDEEQI